MFFCIADLVFFPPLYKTHSTCNYEDSQKYAEKVLESILLDKMG